MMMGPMMQQKEVFEKYFKIDLLMMISDRVSNVRIILAKVLRHHFMKEISGAFVNDPELNDAVRLLKHDASVDVRSQVLDIETLTDSSGSHLSMESFVSHLEDLRQAQHAQDNSDSQSSYSEDEMRIEAEIRRHNSEDDIDHGPVLQSLRRARHDELVAEQDAKRLQKEQKRKEREQNATKALLDDHTGQDVD